MKCIHADADGFCTNKEMQGGGFKCFKCLGFKPSKEKTQMAKKAAVVVPEVVDEKVCKDIARREDAAQRTVIKKAIGRQVQVVQGVELRSNFEKLKLGAMVSEAVRQLKLEDPAANRGRNAAGGGALGWWDDVCPRDKDGQPVIAYKTVMQWKEAAERLPALLASEVKVKGEGEQRSLPAPEKMMALLAKNPKKAVGKDAKILASAEKLANGMTMRQMLLWGGDEQAKGRGRKPGSKANSSEVDTHIAKTAEEKAAAAEQEMREIVGTLGAFLTRGGKINMLTAQAKSDFHTSLVDYAKLLEEQM